ncbi:MAG: helix-turn-helix domain-containing protein [bacterium]|nr:helix-turn-helix domain-containing protein [bacterium]
MPPVSQILRQTRERLGISLEEVAQRTYIKLPYLVALEEGDVSKLPAQVYIHGYIRQYAKLLDLSGSDLVQQYQEDASKPPIIGMTTTPVASPVAVPVGAPVSFPGFSNGPSSPVFPPRLTTADRPVAELPPSRPVALTSGASEGAGETRLPVSPTDIDLTGPRLGDAVTRIPAAASAPTEAVTGSRLPRPEQPPRVSPREVDLPVLGGTHPAGSGLEMLEARKTASEIVQSAQREAAEFRKAADQYADQVLGQLADEIGRTLQIVRNGKAFLQSRRKQRQADHA